ncbi:MAG: elongation factor P maturation arginine rhamnosyltransferase EarP [Alistipes senegalensis]|nr:elongation factor P maturation arginine rhamnosyltransferase EarP [Oxalobacter formigenes]MCM1280973.1 elongation factor P maturation arginine rhamnosyltransferase EarP [Alistipes senegalensis]
MPADIRLDLFCKVIDNYGDAGVCWRLARQLAREYPVKVRLWIDQIFVLKRIVSESDWQPNERLVCGIEVREWSEPFPVEETIAIPDVVVEGFGCRLPDSYVSAMANRQVQPVWINMEYLSAESWVEACHEMLSMHPMFSLKKYFFFPGFTEKTGGLIRESQLARARQQFQQDSTARSALFNRLGIKENAACFLSLFCYDHAPVSSLFEMLAQQDRQHICCVVPEGVASRHVSLFLGMAPKAGSVRTKGRLTVRVIPFVDQDEYDRLLWSCDLNIVRGEDSFVRAQWAAKPFIWHIYPQKEAAHVPKLCAFLDRYLAGLSASASEVVQKAWMVWNRIGIAEEEYAAVLRSMFFTAWPDVARHATAWERKIAEKKDFASSLFRFILRMR